MNGAERLHQEYMRLVSLNSIVYCLRQANRNCTDKPVIQRCGGCSENYLCKKVIDLLRGQTP